MANFLCVCCREFKAVTESEILEKLMARPLLYLSSIFKRGNSYDYTNHTIW